MLGAFLRIGLSTLGGVLIGAILGRVLPYFTHLMGPTEGLLYQSFAAIEEHALLVMILSGVFALFARATVEGGVVQ